MLLTKKNLLAVGSGRGLADAFRDLYPGGLEVTGENLEGLIDAGISIYWLSGRLLQPEERVGFNVEVLAPHVGVALEACQIAYRAVERGESKEALGEWHRAAVLAVRSDSTLPEAYRRLIYGKALRLPTACRMADAGLSAAQMVNVACVYMSWHADCSFAPAVGLCARAAVEAGTPRIDVFTRLAERING